MLKFLLVVVIIALAVYGCVMLVDRQLNGVKRPPRPRRAQPKRPLGPDDDPEFLRQLNRRKPPKPPNRDD